MTELENSMETMIRIFHHYAVQDGDKKFLSKKELRKLVETELPNFVRAQNNPKLFDRMMKDLDHDKDDKLDFEEFFPLIAGLNMTCEKIFNAQQKKCKK